MFQNNLPNGFGIYVNKEGLIFKGNWVDEIKQGQGHEIRDDGKLEHHIIKI
jgi:hypothetical protein